MLSIITPALTLEEECKRWENFIYSNCYVFALSLGEKVTRLLPGEIAGDITRNGLGKPEKYSDSRLLKCIFADIQALGLHIKEVEKDDVVTESEAWKIVVLNCDYRLPYDSYDFHFMRQNRITGEWYHKCVGELPKMQDILEKTITNPEKACFDFPYQLVGYFIISK